MGKSKQFKVHFAETNKKNEFKKIKEVNASRKWNVSDVVDEDKVNTKLLKEKRRT